MVLIRSSSLRLARGSAPRSRREFARTRPDSRRCRVCRPLSTLTSPRKAIWASTARRPRSRLAFPWPRKARLTVPLRVGAPDSRDAGESDCGNRAARSERDRRLGCAHLALDLKNSLFFGGGRPKPPGSVVAPRVAPGFHPVTSTALPDLGLRRTNGAMQAGCSSACGAPACHTVSSPPAVDGSRRTRVGFHLPRTGITARRNG